MLYGPLSLPSLLTLLNVSLHLLLQNSHFCKIKLMSCCAQFVHNRRQLKFCRRSLTLCRSWTHLAVWAVYVVLLKVPRILLIHRSHRRPAWLSCKEFLTNLAEPNLHPIPAPSVYKLGKTSSTVQLPRDCSGSHIGRAEGK